MSAGVTTTELQEFALFIQAKLTAGETKLTPEEVLDQWREEHPTDEEFEESCREIQEALDEMNRGERGMSLEEVRQEFENRRAGRVQQP